MTHDCSCGRPIQDTAIICPHCGFEMDAALAELVEEPLCLAAELDVTLSKQARMAERNGSRSAETATAFNGAAAEVGFDVKAVLVKWMGVIVKGTGADVPADTIVGLAAALRPWVGWLRHHEAGQDAHDEIVEAVRQVWRVVDRPPGNLYAGPCDACGQDLYARVGAKVVRCRNLECRTTDGDPHIYSVEDRRQWLLSALDDHLDTSVKLSHLVKYLGIEVPDRTIRFWSEKKRIVSHGRDREGNKLYRLGEVVRVYYKAQQARADGRQKAAS